MCLCPLSVQFYHFRVQFNPTCLKFAIVRPILIVEINLSGLQKCLMRKLSCFQTYRRQVSIVRNCFMDKNQWLIRILFAALLSRLIARSVNNVKLSINYWSGFLWVARGGPCEVRTTVSNQLRNLCLIF